MNLDALKVRARVLRQLRAFFDARGFVEVETPVRIAAPAPEPHIDCPAVLPHPAASREEVTYLRASPELQMKRLLSAGLWRGVRLEARVHIVTGAVASAQNIIKCCNRAGVDVADIVLEQLASSK